MKKLSLFFILLLIGIMFCGTTHAQVTFQGIPIIPDENTVLLDHFDSTTLGEIVGSVQYVPSLKGLSSAIDFTNTGNYLIYGTLANLQYAGTIEMWINPKSFNKDLFNINLVKSANMTWENNDLDIRLSSEGKIYILTNGPQFSSNYGIKLNTWSHIAVSWGESTKIYINGILDMESADSLRTVINLGQSYFYVPNWFNENFGYMDELHVSKVQRTNAEIASRVKRIDPVKIINLTAGTLSQHLTTDEMATITNLQLYGSIDARDFKVMRDSLVALSEVDLKNVNISEYTGTQGTGPTNTYYPPNTIPQNAFLLPDNEIYKFTSIILPTSITAISDSAFYNCWGLISITIPNSVISIGNGSFELCNLTGIQIPSSVISIGVSAFSRCSQLRDVALPNSIISIGNFAFESCDKLTGTITIPNSVKTIGIYAFADCQHLKGIVLSNSLTAVSYAAFAGCSELTDVSIPTSITSLSDYAFYGCSILSHLIIPNSVTTIGEAAFMMSGLTGMTLPNSITTIGNEAFERCRLIDIEIPNSVTSIGSYAYYAGGSGTLSIPSSVVSIGTSAFEGCILTSIYPKSTIPIDLSYSPTVFNQTIKSTCILYVPAGSKPLYQAANQWKDFTHIVEMAPNGLNELTNNEHFILYPNPFTEGFYMDAVDKHATVSVYNLMGVKLLSKQITSKSYMDMAGLPQGQYVVKILTDVDIIEKKLIKK